MQTAHFHALPARVTAAVVGCTLVLLTGLVSSMRVDVRSPVVASLAIAIALWLVWMVFDFAFAPQRAARAHTPPPETEDDPPRPFADTEARWHTS